MTLNELDSNLSRICDDYASEMRLTLSHSSCDSETKNLADELCRQTFYALLEFKTELINYLDK